MQTRNNQCLVKLPKIKTEYARKSFRFMGAKIYNELPLDIRKTESFNAYEQHLNLSNILLEPSNLKYVIYYVNTIAVNSL